MKIEDTLEHLLLRYYDLFPVRKGSKFVVTDAAVAWFGAFVNNYLEPYNRIFMNVPPEGRHEPPAKYWERLHSLGEHQFPEMKALKKAKQELISAWKERPAYVKGLLYGTGTTKKTQRTSN